jgi:hypothetical protein
MKRFTLTTLFVAAVVLCSGGTAFADKHYNLSPPRTDPPEPNASGVVTTSYVGIYEWIDPWSGMIHQSYMFNISLTCQGLTPLASYGFTVQQFYPHIDARGNFDFSTDEFGTAEFTATVYLPEKKSPNYFYVWNAAGTRGVLTYPQANY